MTIIIPDLLHINILIDREGVIKNLQLFDNNNLNNNVFLYLKLCQQKQPRYLKRIQIR
jgi:hypothetical protein